MPQTRELSATKTTLPEPDPSELTVHEVAPSEEIYPWNIEDHDVNELTIPLPEPAIPQPALQDDPASDPPTPRTTPPGADSPGPDRPFLVERRRAEETPAGYFRPAARLLLTPALRTGGLWHALPAEEMRTLLLMLTFLTPNGHVHPTILEMADAMQVSEGKARSRLSRLTQISWQGAPIVRALPRENGLDAFALAPHLVWTVEAPSAVSSLPEPGYRAAGRDAILAYSRAHYATPRAEVEAQIARFYGWDERQEQDRQAEERERALTDEQRALLDQMRRVGMDREQALAVLDEHAPERIGRQLAWLPYRHAKNPAAFLLAALAGDYAPPAALRQRYPQSEGFAAQEHETERHEAAPEGQRRGEETSALPETSIPPAPSSVADDA